MVKNCEHSRIKWVSGVEGLKITLNGDIVAECLDCEQVATLEA